MTHTWRLWANKQHYSVYKLNHKNNTMCGLKSCMHVLTKSKHLAECIYFFSGLGALTHMA